MVEQMIASVIAASAAPAQEAPVNEFGFISCGPSGPPVEGILTLLAIAVPIIFVAAWFMFRMPSVSADAED